MDKNSNLELLYNPSLILLIDNPTEKDLFNVIYSDNLKLSVIRDLPDGDITPRVATYALCLTKTWGIEELKVWFNKFFPHVLSKDYVKVFKSILSGIVGSTEDIDLFIDLFGQVENPPKDLIDFYIGEANYNRVLFGVYQDNCYGFSHTRQNVINISGLTDNLVGKLDKNQQNKIVDSLDKQYTDRYYGARVYKQDFILLHPFLTDTGIYNKAKEIIGELAKENSDIEKQEKQDKSYTADVKNHWWNKIF